MQSPGIGWAILGIRYMLGSAHFCGFFKQLHRRMPVPGKGSPQSPGQGGRLTQTRAEKGGGPEGGKSSGGPRRNSNNTLSQPAPKSSLALASQELCLESIFPTPEEESGREGGREGLPKSCFVGRGERKAAS
ncbi:UNVERIFIED_CONTAM: hypothetical protein K2H54_015916 [Gekko kuhli]